jgi:hypothetical protein
VLAATASGAAAITVATAAAANNGAIMRALSVIVNLPDYSLRRPSDRYDSERGFGLIVKTPLAFSRFNGAVSAGVQRIRKNIDPTARTA